MAKCQNLIETIIYSLIQINAQLSAHLINILTIAENLPTSPQNSNVYSVTSYIDIITK